MEGLLQAGRQALRKLVQEQSQVANPSEVVKTMPPRVHPLILTSASWQMTAFPPLDSTATQAWATRMNGWACMEEAAIIVMRAL